MTFQAWFRHSDGLISDLQTTKNVTEVLLWFIQRWSFFLWKVKSLNLFWYSFTYESEKSQDQILLSAWPGPQSTLSQRRWGDNERFTTPIWWHILTSLSSGLQTVPAFLRNVSQAKCVKRDIREPQLSSRSDHFVILGRINQISTLPGLTFSLRAPCKKLLLRLWVVVVMSCMKTISSNCSDNF